MVDGSFCPETGAGGFGYWIASYRGKRPGGGPIKGASTNPTEVEMKAVCNALVEAVNSGLVQPGDKVLVQTDSKNAIRAFEGNRIPGEEAERETVRFLNQYKKKADLTLVFRHVKGHSDAPGARYAANNHCDTRAKQAMRKVRYQLIGREKNVQAASRPVCCCSAPWRLLAMRPLRVPGDDVRQGGVGVCQTER